ncbi:portal protein [Aliidiomarina maris]|uniref:Portal protein n=1 Tax=Aliidiomarina maris TaxID=531312 RepID=A0A327X7I4_9GAMM|nr:hypothetical protein [Aliidiomarina maris]RAK01612.1 hypothetical protein B0I24_101235 [Aliidiomarina maris]RUO28438.1 hypothetical protein CWE07_01125 [Aliidiomarina maris]
MSNKPEPNQYEHEYDEKNPLDLLAMELERQLAEVLRDRQTIEHRMVEDLQNYHGEYDSEVVKALKEAKRAHPFIKLTRAKTNAAESQLVDLLFPNDDKNWAIEPTPVPELAGKIGDDTPVTMNGQSYQDEEGNIVTESDLAERELELIRERCLNMEAEIEDQLVESSYNAMCRKAIHDACVVGTGVLKGPVVIGKTDRAYVEVEGEWQMVVKESFTPAVEVVRPWDFYPDMSASHISEAEFAFERRYMSKQQVRDLVKRKGFPKQQVARVLKMKPEETQHNSSYQDDVRRLAGLSDTLNDTRYETWEYHGPISREVLLNLGVIGDIPDDEDEFDEWLQEGIVATVFYCGGIVLGARTHLITYEGYLPYRVFNWEEDDSSIFGYGVPRMVRDEQAIINSVWRTMLDNASITAGPQIGRNRKHIKPANGEWTLEPFKQWDMIGGTGDIKQAFSTFEFTSHLNELSAIYQTSRILFDEVSGVPMMQQGEQGEATQTLGGMSILMNAANTVRRRQVKAWDDNVTSPIIGDFYHWNMVNNDRADIKGDFQVDARGTGALLVRETLAMALTNFLQMAAGNEVFAPVLQIKQLQIMRLWARTQQLPADIIPSEDELRAYYENLQEQSQASDPQIEIEQLRIEQLQKKFEFEQKVEEQKLEAKMLELQVKAELKERELGAQLQAKASSERIEMMKMAQNKELSSEKLLVELKKGQAKLDQDWSQFVAEIEMKNIFGKRGNFGLGQ